MNPAFSVLFFTVLSGAGYGLVILLVLFHLANRISSEAVFTSSVIALILITIGLLCSTQHLANPKNAWRAFSRFQSSWLSREAVFAVLFYPFIGWYLLSGWLPAGVIAALIALVTLFCTAMIYASLKTIQQWHTAFTPINYLLLGLCSGALLLMTIQAAYEQTPYLLPPVLLLLLAATSKTAYVFWLGKPATSTIKTATGFTQASVRLLDQGHSSNGFLNNEFGYTLAANKLLVLRVLMLVLAFLLPLVLLLSGSGFAVLLMAVLTNISGLLLERWLFFAEARHVVRLYHGDQ